MGLKLKPKSGGGDFESAPAGNHPAVCVAVIDLGTQETSYQNKVEYKQQVFLVWELVTEKMTGMKDQNHVIGRSFTASLHEKAMLRGFIEKWRGAKLADDAEFDLEKLVGQPCLLSVVLTEKGYPKIETATAVPKGMAVPKPQHTPFFSTLEDDKDIPEWVPFIYGEKVQDVINRCQEAKGASVPSENVVGLNQAVVSPAENEAAIPF
jgi:hypothetical protein